MEHDSAQAILAISVLVFGAMTIGSLAFIRVNDGVTASAFFKLAGLAMVALSATFLLVASFTESQITPMLGLLGTIAGYIVGRPDSKPDLPRPPQVDPTTGTE